MRVHRRQGQRSQGLSPRPSEGGGVGGGTADHLNCPVGKAAADWRAINRWWEGEDTVDGHSNRRPRRQRSHMGPRNSRWGDGPGRQMDVDADKS